MSLPEILASRYSCRGFRPDAIAPELLTQIFDEAQRSPSNCNVQPWQVLVASGGATEQLKAALVKEVMTRQTPNPDFNWAVAYQNEHRERQFGAANALYGALGIDRQDKLARQQAMLRNWQFFDAPHVAIFTMDTYLDIMGAVDVGIYAQTLSLLMHEHGLATCMQGALGQFPDPIREMFALPEGRGVLFGMSFGYADEEAPANRARTTREPLANSVVFHD
ncbi:MAG: nitroreductase [Pseudomonadota bacterium]